MKKINIESNGNVVATFVAEEGKDYENAMAAVRKVAPLFPGALIVIEDKTLDDAINSIKETVEEYTIPSVIVAEVEFNEGGKSYAYLYEGEDELNVGDTVYVPVGQYGHETAATVVSVGEYRQDKTPYPVEDMSYVLDVKKDKASDLQKQVNDLINLL